MYLEIYVSESIVGVTSVHATHWRQMVIYTVYSDTMLHQGFSVSLDQLCQMF